MFMIAAKTFVAECDALAPETAAAARRAVELAQADLDFVRLDVAAFEMAPSMSVDHEQGRCAAGQLRLIRPGGMGCGGRRTRPTLQAMSYWGLRCCQTPPIPW